jgi:hypothetical protein
LKKFADQLMKTVLLSLFAVLVILVGSARAELSIEAFWLGEERFREEMAPEWQDEMPERQAGEVSAAESRFIEEGDRLWDLRAHYEGAGFDFEGGWVVYNETSGYLVAKAEPHDLGALELRHSPEKWPQNFRLKWNLFEMEDEREGWVDWKNEWEDTERTLLFGTEMTGRSGETQTLAFEEKEGFEVSLELQVTLYEYGQFCDLRSALEIETPSFDYTLKTGLSLKTGNTSYLELGTVGGTKTLVAELLPEVLLVGGPSRQEWHQSETAAATARDFDEIRVWSF